MDNLKIQKEVARLDGFLMGIAAFSGKIRDYSAFAYLVEVEQDVVSVESFLKKFFPEQANFIFSDKEYLDLRNLEHKLRPYLVRDISCVSDGNLLKLQKYLSFRVMELVSVILETNLGDYSNYKNVDVLKIESNNDPSASECIFFCIKIEKIFLVLQFNDNINFKHGNS